jgi:hypothetical protein
MNRADRRRLSRLDVAVSEVSEIAMQEAQKRFNIAFDVMINSFYDAMRESRVSQERADKIVGLMADKVVENGNEIAKASIEKMEGKQ